MSTTFPYDDEKDEMMKMEMMSTTVPYLRGSVGTQVSVCMAATLFRAARLLQPTSCSQRKVGGE